jgi:hypothetical protein
MADDPTKKAAQIMNDPNNNLFAQLSSQNPFGSVVAKDVMKPPPLGVPPPPAKSPVTAKQSLVQNMHPANDPAFAAWFKQHNNGQWDPVDAKGVSGGYNLYRAYQLGLKPDAAGHLPDHGPNGEVLKTDADPNAVTGGIDNRTGYQVAPPNYTGPMTDAVRATAAKYFHAGTAKRPGGPGAWDDVPTGKSAPAKIPPAGYTVPKN